LVEEERKREADKVRHARWEVAGDAGDGGLDVLGDTSTLRLKGELKRDLGVPDGAAGR
jgi:hypothetical protein